VARYLAEYHAAVEMCKAQIARDAIVRHGPRRTPRPPKKRRRLLAK
jgi:hypothetical protein